jgi:hypothetical protein
MFQLPLCDGGGLGVWDTHILHSLVSTVIFWLTLIGQIARCQMGSSFSLVNHIQLPPVVTVQRPWVVAALKPPGTPPPPRLEEGLSVCLCRVLWFWVADIFFTVSCCWCFCCCCGFFWYSWWKCREQELTNWLIIIRYCWVWCMTLTFFNDFNDDDEYYYNKLSVISTPLCWLCISCCLLVQLFVVRSAHDVHVVSVPWPTWISPRVDRLSTWIRPMCLAPVYIYFN